jgi:hypothetical protein
MTPGPLEIRIDVKGGTEVAEHFVRAGSEVRSAVRTVLESLGSEIASRARATVPANRARNAIFVRTRDRGTGTLSVVVNTQRRFRWVQQFEYGTVGTGPAAKTGTVELRVRGYSRHASKGDVFQVVGRTRRKAVASGVVFVHGYQRLQHMPTKPFMGPAFNSVRGEVVPRIQAAVNAALAFGEVKP